MSDTHEQKRDRASVDLVDAVDGFALQNTTAPVVAPSAAPAPKSRRKQPLKPGSDEPPQVISYRHADRRVNNPEVGMVTPATDPDALGL